MEVYEYSVSPTRKQAKSISTRQLPQEEDDEKDGEGFHSQNLSDNCDCQWTCQYIRIWEREEGLRSIGVG